MIQFFVAPDTVIAAGALRIGTVPKSHRKLMSCQSVSGLPVMRAGPSSVDPRSQVFSSPFSHFPVDSAIERSYNVWYEQKGLQGDSTMLIAPVHPAQTGIIVINARPARPRPRDASLRSPIFTV